MLNPITEIKASITTAKVIQRDLNQTLKEKQKAIHSFYSAKEKAEQTACSDKTPEVPTKTNITAEKTAPPKRIIADEEKEKQLLEMAKAHYQSYEDVAKFAKALDLRPGIVYLTLKHHSFIKQTESTQYRVLDSYYKNNGNLRAITEDVKLNVWLVSKTLEQLGISPNWASYKERAETGNVGDWAEEEFKRLVPNALDMNIQYQMNNPVFDFIVNEKTIDVKSANPRASRNTFQYAFRIRSHIDDEVPDFFCFFLIKDKIKEPKQGNYHILLIPKEILPEKNLSITIVPKGVVANSAMYWDFEVEPSALAAMLGDL
ncbi:riboflavin synthase subunit alpha [Ursidibacter arcticus]